MTDQQLLDAGERLYNAFLGSKFTFLELAGLAAARERRTQWPELGQNLKLAVFRLVVLSQPEEATTGRNSEPAPSQAATAIESPARVERTAVDEASGGSEVPESARGGAKASPLDLDPADIGEDTTATKNGEAAASSEGEDESSS